MFFTKCFSLTQAWYLIEPNLPTPPVLLWRCSLSQYQWVDPSALEMVLPLPLPAPVWKEEGFIWMLRYTHTRTFWMVDWWRRLFDPCPWKEINWGQKHLGRLVNSPLDSTISNLQFAYVADHRLLDNHKLLVCMGWTVTLCTHWHLMQGSTADMSNSEDWVPKMFAFRTLQRVRRPFKLSTRLSSSSQQNQQPSFAALEVALTICFSHFVVLLRRKMLGLQQLRWIASPISEQDPSSHQSRSYIYAGCAHIGACRTCSERWWGSSCESKLLLSRKLLRRQVNLTGRSGRLWEQWWVDITLVSLKSDQGDVCRGC